MLREFKARPLVFSRYCDGHLKVDLAAVKTMASFVQSKEHMPESGGVLLGRYIANSDDIVVDQVTTPLPGDRQRRNAYYRDREHHQEAIDRAWEESCGTCTYLGEWHTHAEIMPAPSLIDQINWRRKLLVDRFAGHLFFMILGMSEIRVWEGRRWKPRLSCLERMG